LWMFLVQLRIAPQAVKLEGLVFSFKYPNANLNHKTLFVKALRPLVNRFRPMVGQSVFAGLWLLALQVTLKPSLTLFALRQTGY
jgi:hypothetical protein